MGEGGNVLVGRFFKKKGLEDETYDESLFGKSCAMRGVSDGGAGGFAPRLCLRR